MDIFCSTIADSDPGFNTSSIPDCANPRFLSCEMATVDFEALLSGEDLDIFGDHVMMRVNEMDSFFGDMKNYIYKDESGLNSAIFTYDHSDGFDALEGVIEFDGEIHAYVIENCGEDCHVLIQVSLEKEKKVYYFLTIFLTSSSKDMRLMPTTLRCSTE